MAPRIPFPVWLWVKIGHRRYCGTSGRHSGAVAILCSVGWHWALGQSHPWPLPAATLGWHGAAYPPAKPSAPTGSPPSASSRPGPGAWDFCGTGQSSPACPPRHQSGVEDRLGFPFPWRVPADLCPPLLHIQFSFLTAGLADLIDFRRNTRDSGFA